MSIAIIESISELECKGEHCYFDVVLLLSTGKKARYQMYDKETYERLTQIGVGGKVEMGNVPFLNQL